jgi:DNA-directed RNA polymerase specialized sigma24 family protein
MSAPLLTAAKRALRKRDAADKAARDAVMAAHDAGHSYREIARACGVSSAWAHKLTRPLRRQREERENDDA